MKLIKAGKIEISNNSSFVLIAGPCVIESEASAISIAGKIKQITSAAGIPFIFKASYDKANRSSIKSFRGIGIEKGLKTLKLIKEKHKIPVLTDVHCRHDVKEVAEVADLLQIPAYLCRQTDLLVECAKTGRIVNVKKGQFLSPYDMANVIAKIEAAGCKNIVLTERGATFGYNNLVTDIRSLAIMKQTGYPVIFDATHSVQIPGGLGISSGGQRQFIEPLSKAAIAVSIAGIFMEVHPNPAKALSDGPNSVSLKDLKVLLNKLKAIDDIVKK